MIMDDPEKKESCSVSVNEVQPTKILAPLPLLRLDKGEERTTLRTHWWQFWIPRDPPPPARESLEDAPIIPLATASFLSTLTYSWITSIMVLGYQRTLQASDLWKMDETRQSGFLSNKLDIAWARRVEEAKAWNEKLSSGEIKPGVFKRVKWSVQAIKGGRKFGERRVHLETQWREKTGRKEASLAWALNDTFGVLFWLGGLFKVIGDTSQLMSPLLVKAIINYGKEKSAARTNGTKEPNLGRGIGMAIALFLLVIIASVARHQFFWRSMATGIFARAALINSIYKRGVNLTGKARTTMTNAALVNFISTDVSRVDACAQWFHAGWTAPIQVVICLAILLVQLGPSALAGFSLFFFIVPLQERIMAYQHHIRKASVKFTDQRARLFLEVLGSMRVVKYFSYEVPFLTRIFAIRKNELRGIGRIQNSRSANIAFAYSVPVLAATLSFVTYTKVVPGFDVAVIFASFSLFQILRQPMMFLPRALSGISDAKSALTRLTKLFHAEVIDGPSFIIDPTQIMALRIENATFEWESFPSSKTKTKERHRKAEAKDEPPEYSTTDSSRPFQLVDIDMTVPRGSLVAVVGRVGSGKSSLLQGIIGEMRRSTGHVSLGGTVAYCPQSAWIQNATLRDNIIFGQPFDNDKYWAVLEESCLLPDLRMLSDGDMTEIGEKGINLSGGQKQRVNIARALYYNAEIVVLDDPLSAVDAHVGQKLFHGAILNSLKSRGKTVILVTHALHFLSQCDYIYTLDDSRIAEQGTYQELIARGGEFARLDKEFGGQTGEHKVEADGADEAIQVVSTAPVEEPSKTQKDPGQLMVKEKRTTGSVSWRIYWAYIVAGRGYMTVPLIILAMVLMQGSQILNSYTLVWWQADTFNRPFSFYQGLYAALGISQAMFTFLLGMGMDTMSALVSQNLHHDSVRNIFYAPMSFFDTTPMGRIQGIFGKDIDSIDNQLAVSMRMFALTMANVVGSVLIITIVEHYFIIVALAIALAYGYFAAFYRESSREIKRLDAMLRSVLYAHFSESLTGLPTIRSYGEMPRFIRDNKYYIDLENRALLLTVTNQRWLAIRLDFLGGILVFIVALFAVVGLSGISAAQIGLVLTYTTNLTTLCGLVTRQSAEVENYMNAVERVIHYSRGDMIPQEAPHEIEATKPPPQWPTCGAIEFKNIVMKYRPGLPDVLRGISADIKGGEKIGIIGRTGAGKSSLTLALYRIIELSSGSISIDGIDISSIGLRDLRTKISIIPQDPLLFSGTVRSNLDPFSIYDDARLWDALRRSYLVDPETDGRSLAPDDGEGHHGRRRIRLDTVIESEGANLSVGERSLLSLARALVKDARVVILDEATASVDYATDSKIQRTIQTQFKDRTLLCIAHRLRTILSYDRIMCLDAGVVSEFDTPLNLFMIKDGIFRTFCDQSDITLQDIEISQGSLVEDDVVDL